MHVLALQAPWPMRAAMGPRGHRASLADAADSRRQAQPGVWILFVALSPYRAVDAHPGRNKVGRPHPG
jgi:hypothetical protein